MTGPLRDRRRLRGQGAVALATCVLAIAVAPLASLGQVWSPAQTLDSSSGQMEVAAGPDDRFVALWQKEQLRLAFSSGRRGFGRSVGRRIRGSATLAATGPGSALVAWDEELFAGSLRSRIHVAAASPRGVGPDEVVSPPAVRMGVEHVLTGAFGRALVSWYEEAPYSIGGATYREGAIVAAQRSPGMGFGTPTAISSVPAFEHAAAMDVRGDALIVWSTSRGVMRVSAQVADTPFGPSRRLSLPGGFSRSPTVAFDADGNATAGWAQSRSNGGYRIRVAYRPATEARFGRPRAISSPEGVAGVPQVTSGPDGVATVVYVALGARSAVRAVRLHDGKPIGRPVTLSRGRGVVDFRSTPLIEGDSRGGVVAVWSASFGDVRAQVGVTGKDGRYTAPRRLSARGENTKTFADTSRALAVSPSGGAVTIWAGTRGLRAARLIGR